MRHEEWKLNALCQNLIKVLKDKKFYLERSNRKIQLKSSYKYFYQIQGQIFCTQLKRVDFEYLLCDNVWLFTFYGSHIYWGDDKNLEEIFAWRGIRILIPKFNILTCKYICIHKFKIVPQPWWDIQIWEKIHQFFWRYKAVKGL